MSKTPDTSATVLKALAILEVIANAPHPLLLSEVTAEIGFDDLPEAMERQERRETTGRIVVRVGA